MLLQVLATEIEQRCDVCGTRRRLGLADLQAGVEDGDPPEPVDPNIIVLPPCTDCGAQEFLNRVDTGRRGAEAGGLDDVAEHRRGVNALHAQLVAAGRVGATLREWFTTESLVFERAEIPWTFPSEPAAVVGRAGESEVDFAAYVASRRGGA